VPRTHREIARVVAEELAQRDDILAVLLVGSAARRTEVATSDVDLLTVLTGADRKDTKPRSLRDGYLVEIWAKTEAEWEERFRRAKAMWIYSFLEADVLHDTGCAARLRSAAQFAYDAYETPEQLREELATTLRHGEPKLRRALQAGGEQAGYWALVFLPGILDALYAAHDRPPPPGSRRLDLLHTLPLSGEERRHVTVSCTGSADERLSAVADLNEMLTQRLGPPHLESA
jgi:predicted nucleotidyltransferase